MSRSDPYKRKLKQANTTCLIVVEGYTEKAFCQYLKNIYARNSGIRITIENAHGGSPDKIVQHALSRTAYDYRYCMIDTDRLLSAKSRAKAHTAKITLIESTPCIEGLFLTMLQITPPPSSNDCKKIFSTHLPDHKKTIPDSYAKLFTPTSLANSNHPIIKTLSQSFTNPQHAHTTTTGGET